MSDVARPALWTRAWKGISSEFKHAPIGTFAAVIALFELIWGLFGGELRSHPVAIETTPARELPTGRSEILPALQFFVFQVVISFAWHRLNLWFDQETSSVRMAVGLLSTIGAAYLTSLNAAYFTIFEIPNNGHHYRIFEGFWLLGFAISILFMTVLSIEQYSNVDRRTIVYRLVLTVLPMAVVFLGACLLFDSNIENNWLEPVWKAATHA